MTLSSSASRYIDPPLAHASLGDAARNHGSRRVTWSRLGRPDGMAVVTHARQSWQVEGAVEQGGWSGGGQ